MAIIYGAITLHRDYVRSTEFIKSIGKDLTFPQISTADFGLGDYENYYHDGNLMYNYSWDNMVISYALTTGAAIFDEPSLEVFILKMEYILRNIDFVKAIIHIQSVESLENENLFWEKKEHRYFQTHEELKKEHLLETDEWNFGYGKRSLSGYLEESPDQTIYSLKHHPYPPRFSDEATGLFFDHIKLLIRDYGINEIPIAALEANIPLSKIDIWMLLGCLLFKKIIAIVEIKDNVEVIQVIAPDLLKIDCLYR